MRFACILASFSLFGIACRDKSWDSAGGGPSDSAGGSVGDDGSGGTEEIQTGGSLTLDVEGYVLGSFTAELGGYAESSEVPELLVEYRPGDGLLLRATFVTVLPSEGLNQVEVFFSPPPESGDTYRPYTVEDPVDEGDEVSIEYDVEFHTPSTSGWPDCDGGFITSVSNAELDKYPEANGSLNWETVEGVTSSGWPLAKVSGTVAATIFHTDVINADWLGCDDQCCEPIILNIEFDAAFDCQGNPSCMSDGYPY